ncbi:MAG: helix-turn-helix domain-containing protein [Aeropyrum sp.]|nr:helix-turn-helix domain-containing protein [Aeropyrum sp.]
MNELMRMKDIDFKQCNESSEDLLSKILRIYENDIKIKILLYLATNGEPASIRKIARNVKISHKNVIKHINVLEEAGLVEIMYSQSNLKLYTIKNNLKIYITTYLECNIKL